MLPPTIVSQSSGKSEACKYFSIMIHLVIIDSIFSIAGLSKMTVQTRRFLVVIPYKGGLIETKSVSYILCHPVKQHDCCRSLILRKNTDCVDFDRINSLLPGQELPADPGQAVLPSRAKRLIKIRMPEQKSDCLFAGICKQDILRFKERLHIFGQLIKMPLIRRKIQVGCTKGQVTEGSEQFHFFFVMLQVNGTHGDSGVGDMQHFHRFRNKSPVSCAFLFSAHPGKIVRIIWLVIVAVK